MISVLGSPNEGQNKSRDRYRAQALREIIGHSMNWNTGTDTNAIPLSPNKYIF